MIHREELERIRSIMIDNKNDFESELISLPEGEIYCMRNGDKTFYYERLPKHGNRKKEKRIGITKNTDRIMALVRKKYLLNAISKIKKDIKTIEMAIKHYKEYDEISVMGKFLEMYPELSEGIYHGRQNDEEWADNYVRQTGFYEGNLKHLSPDGVMMRSKNEVYIASRLDHFDIPYRYEARVNHPDVTSVPDFTIRRPRDGKIIYWEHLGMTESDAYMQGNERKFIEYKEVGIVPWDNLIITYDMSGGNIDAKIIDAMINGWLL